MADPALVKRVSALSSNARLKDLAVEIGISASTLSLWLRDKYTVCEVWGVMCCVVCFELCICYSLCCVNYRVRTVV